MPADPPEAGPSSGLTKQSQAERRAIRCQYRELIESIGSNQQELSQVVKKGETDHLKEALLSVEETFKKVETPREGVLDAQCVKNISQVSLLRVQKLCTNLYVFNPKEFGKKLYKFLNQDRTGEVAEENCHIDGDGWARLGDGVQCYFKKSPPLRYMYGSFEPGPPVAKARKERKVRQKDDEPKKAVVPQQLKDFSETKKTENTTQEVNSMLHTLNKLYKQQSSSPLCYFEFVVNPESYSNTIENIFYAAFLVKDGYAKVYLDDDKLPVIEPVQRKEGREQPAEKRNQVVTAMSYEKYQQIIDTFNIKGAPLIPTRTGLNDDDDDEDMPPPPKKR